MIVNCHAGRTSALADRNRSFTAAYHHVIVNGAIAVAAGGAITAPPRHRPGRRRGDVTAPIAP